MIVVEVSCGNNDDKVLVCHNGNTICIAASAVPAHLAHGDFLGPCSATSDPCSVGGGFAIIPQFYQPDEDNSEPIVWPIPGGNELNIKLPSGVTGTVLVELRTMTGQTLKSISIMEGLQSASINEVNALAEGIYYIRITDSAGSLWMIKWMKL